MSRKGENITKRKDGRWEARYIKSYDFNGKAIYGYLYAHTYTEAREKKKQALFNLPRKKSNAKISVQDIANEFLISKRYDVKESTFVHYTQIVEQHISPIIGKRPLTEISAIVIDDLKTHLLTAGRLDGNGGLSNKSVKEILALLKQILKYANFKGYIPETPAFITVPKVQKPTIKVLSREEQLQLEQYTINDDNKKYGIYLCLYTGLRLGELCALKWSDIDIEMQTITVSHTMQRIEDADHASDKKTKIIIDSPKTESSYREIPIPLDVAQDLSIRKQSISDDEYFFLTGSSKYIEPRSYYKYYKKCEKDCGIGDYTFHALRHTFATRCVECGFDAKSLSEILGHTDVKITLDRYVHPSMDLKRKYMEQLRISV